MQNDDLGEGRSWRCASRGILIAILALSACGDDGGSAIDAASVIDSAVADASSTADAAAIDAGVNVTTFVNPPEWTDTAGVYELTIQAAEVVIDGTTYCLRTWNGSLPGPTLRIPSGTARQVRVDFTNAMTTEDLQTVGPPGGPTYDFNKANLHTHGLHVQPEMATGTAFLADNVLVHHTAGETAQYRFDIDEDEATRGRPHEPGTFWYHSHVHGSTAIQVANGMAGAIIVEGTVDALAGISTAEERIFIMTHIPLAGATPLPAGTACNDASLSINNFMLVAGAPTSVQVNGLIKPRIVVPPGQVERWRLVHGGVTQQMDLQIFASTDDSCTATTGAALNFHQIAQDGITFPAANQRDHVFMAPGNRADIMVTAPSTDGVYCLAYDQAGATMVVAILEVASGAGTATGAVPSDSDLASSALPLISCSDPVDGTQDAIFSQQVDSTSGAECEGGPPGGLKFNINCKTFNPATPRVITVNRTEEWALSSEGGGSHPFHIHVNPFQVCSGTINGEAQTPHWRDTVWVDQTGGTALTFRTVYENYTGSFVNHCHKLHHEDQGMMEIVRIDPAP